ncbi:MAG: Ig-like domain-containing protein, partial [Deltaproteobacteria bacterium]|nr:Ig-like domain-containing protein [Deltaproteobacteria bacterium]
MRRIVVILLFFALSIIAGCGGGSSSGDTSSGATGGDSTYDGQEVNVADIDGETDVPVSSSFVYTFEKEVDTDTVNSTTFFIVEGMDVSSSVSVKGEYSHNLCVAEDAISAYIQVWPLYSIIQPTDGLTGNTEYTVCIADSIQYLDGTSFTGVSFSFQTGEAGANDGNNGGGNNENMNDDGNNNAQVYESCTTSEVFSVMPVALDDIDYIIPLGAANPGSGHTFPVDHIYFKPTDEAAGFELVSPGDIIITKVDRVDYPGDAEDYSVHFVACNEISGSWMHIDELSEDLLSQLEFSESNCSSYNYGIGLVTACYTNSLNVKLSADDSIGSTDGMFDFTLFDTRVELDILNVAYGIESGIKKYNTVCPLDYFTSACKSQMEGLLGSGDYRRLEPPICGTIDVDEPGAVQGRWFMPGEDESDETRHVGLLPDNVFPSRLGVVSVGVFSGVPNVSSDYLEFYVDFQSASDHVDVPFDEVSNDGQIYCYEGLLAQYHELDSAIPSKIFIIQLTSDTTLRLEAIDGSSCSGSETFSQNVVELN